jgi:hypothetical protein
LFQSHFRLNTHKKIHINATVGEISLIAINLESHLPKVDKYYLVLLNKNKGYFSRFYCNDPRIQRREFADSYIEWDNPTRQQHYTADGEAKSTKYISPKIFRNKDRGALLGKYYQ